MGGDNGKENGSYYLGSGVWGTNNTITMLLQSLSQKQQRWESFQG